MHGSADFLNPDAGNHAVATAPEELAAAERAGERTWAQFPYYERRYGERGRRFCTSDTAWLLTLAHRDEKHAIEQVLWLGHVLASRGMPRYLLEQHLHNLVAELDGPSAASLRAAERRLRTLRRRVIGDAAFDRLAREFDARVADQPEAFAAMGAVLVSAVADEADGIERAVVTVEEWACDAAHFSERWIEAVQATIAAARAISSS